ncbi:MAG: tetratricopeptide repeat protein, partial [Bdellovibrionaceae bacterium]|nr:tetratricopeptide repeat protein [Pseudobdellovibrionaceae bacterium]
MIDLNSRIDDNDPCWLVKVDTRIDGPLSFNEVLSKLTSGELYSHNEVMAPLDRWRTLQSHPLFAAAVEKLRRKNDDYAENTMTRTERTSFTRTLDISFETMTPTPMRETPTPPPPNNPPPLPSSSTTTSAPPPRPLVTPPIFRPQEKKSSAMPLVIGVGALVVAAVVSVLLFSKKTQNISKIIDLKQSSMVGFFDKGFYHKQRGEWSEAIKNFRQAHSLNSKDHYTVFELAPLLVQFENQHIYARNILDKVSGIRFNPEDICLARNAAGLAYSYEGLQDKNNYAKAVQKFDDCLSQISDEGTPSETVSMAKLNKGFALMMMGKYGQAEAILMTSKGMQLQSMAPYLFIIENYLHEGYYKNNKAAFEKAFNLSSQVISNRPFYDGLQEILLFHSYAAYKLGKDTSYVAQALEKAMNMDPDLTTDHYHPPSMDWRVFNWKYFDFVCKDFQNFTRQDLVSWLEFTCSYKQNNEIEADQVLGGWINRSQDKSSVPNIA